VHLHNLAMGAFERDYAFGVDVKPTRYVDPPATFMGLVRPDGRVATRNYIGLLSTVNCSATVVRGIADAFRGDALAAFPNVDGVVALTHGSGCGMDTHGDGMTLLRRTLGGYARHANFGGVLVVGLGCEANQISALFGAQNLKEGPLLRTFSIQDTGGTAKTIAHGIGIVRDMLPHANVVTRERVPASHITIGLQCGGSDGYSGITANPALGAAVDLLVRHGGTAILSETPEIYGAEHLLTRRAVSRCNRRKADRADQVVGGLHRARARRDEQQPVAGQQGRRPDYDPREVARCGGEGRNDEPRRRYEYAETVTAKGFVYMDTPGYDPVSAPGQVAGGANMIVFTTGAAPPTAAPVAVAQAVDEHRAVVEAGRGHRSELRRDRGRHRERRRDRRNAVQA
jgi:altronate hydrolase